MIRLKSYIRACELSVCLDRTVRFDVTLTSQEDVTHVRGGCEG